MGDDVLVLVLWFTGLPWTEAVWLGGCRGVLLDALVLFFEECRQHQILLIWCTILIPPVLTKSWHHNYHLPVPDMGKQKEEFRDTSCNIITASVLWFKCRGEDWETLNGCVQFLSVLPMLVPCVTQPHIKPNLIYFSFRMKNWYFQQLDQRSYSPLPMQRKVSLNCCCY